MIGKASEIMPSSNQQEELGEDDDNVYALQFWSSELRVGATTKVLTPFGSVFVLQQVALDGNADRGRLTLHAKHSSSASLDVKPSQPTKAFTPVLCTLRAAQVDQFSIELTFSEGEVSVCTSPSTH